MIWVSNWNYILRHDRALIWPYLKIHARRIIYWGSLSPVFLPLLVFGLFGVLMKYVAELIDGVFDLIGEGVRFLLKKTGYIKFNTKTDDCYDGLAAYAARRRKERENAS